MRGRRAKREERGQAKRQRPAVCYRMATLRAPFCVWRARQGGRGFAGITRGGTTATKELDMAPKVVALGRGT